MSLVSVSNLSPVVTNHKNLCLQDDCSPGPCYLPQDKYYHTGPDGAPRYSIYGRPKDLTTYKTPGPGAYKPESAGNLYGTSPPKYSFGVRHKYRRTDDIPGEFVMPSTPVYGKRYTFFLTKSH